MTFSSFRDLGVAESLQRALHAVNHTIPTPIQTKTIPLILAGKDVLAVAQTGTGKTAAFALPILQRLAAIHSGTLSPRAARALILAPTRELAVQIGDSFKTYGRHNSFRHAVVVGGVAQQPQIRALARGVDVLIATPGRLLDLINQGHFRGDQVAVLVLDEADRMLDMGFIRDVRKIIATLPKQRQSLLFSATMPADVSQLAGDLLRAPVRVEASPAVVTVDLIDQHVYFVDGAAKRDLLVKLLSDRALARVIVFTRTKHGANRVAENLDKAGIVAEAIHGNKSQGARQRALEYFRTGRARVLVATDIAARGIDVADITHVINYELPNVPESYVHRIGRTGRAGASGIALSFCDHTERDFLRDIEKLTKRSLTVAADLSTRARATPSRPLSGKPARNEPAWGKRGMTGELAGRRDGVAATRHGERGRGAPPRRAA